ncbi:MAG TPA: hypothetical protein EYG11_03690 [Candidatus Latescibacteria bacterium]|nr:hypothetical protein [Candidatus Handelsmanbacteria bacterium]HIL07781.1 hypothetical protein [Candidatus Latescibacterota bacterium]
MRQIPVEEAEVGDIIAEPIQDQSGRVLLPAGAKLSPAVLARLKGWGVFTLNIEGEEQEGGRSKAVLVDKLDQRFAGLEDDEIMMQIKEIARGHLSGS